MQETLVNRPFIESQDVIEREFITVVFQQGLAKDVGVNGCRVDDLLKIALDRLERYQRGALPCVENEQAIRHLKASLRAMNARLERRQQQGVLNTMDRHIALRTEDEIDDFSATGA